MISQLYAWHLDQCESVSLEIAAIFWLEGGWPTHRRLRAVDVAYPSIACEAKGIITKFP